MKLCQVGGINNNPAFWSALHDRLADNPTTFQNRFYIFLLFPQEDGRVNGVQAAEMQGFHKFSILYSKYIDFCFSHYSYCRDENKCSTGMLSGSSESCTPATTRISLNPRSTAGWFTRSLKRNKSLFD